MISEEPAGDRINLEAAVKPLPEGHKADIPASRRVWLRS
jgi:hypothetical protein